MTDSAAEVAARMWRPLPVAVVPGLPMCVLPEGSSGTVVGITQAYCIYRLDTSSALAVANWHEVALGNLCPAPTLLPLDVTENDRRNASATTLRELLGLQQVAPLTPAQSNSLDELVALLCEA